MSKLLEHGISPKPEWIIGCGASRVEGTRAMTALLDQHPEVTAAVCYQDVVALGAMLALRKQGRLIGQNFALVGFDDLPETALVEPALTTVSVAAREIGRKAGELLLERMAGNDEPAKSIILPPYPGGTPILRQPLAGRRQPRFTSLADRWSQGGAYHLLRPAPEQQNRAGPSLCSRDQQRQARPPAPRAASRQC